MSTDVWEHTPGVAPWDRDETTDLPPFGAPPPTGGGGDADWTAPYQQVLRPVTPRHDLVGREQELTEVVAQLCRRRPQPILITGEAGAGRTTLLAGVAGLLAARGDGRVLHRIGPEAPTLIDPLLGMLQAAPEGTIIALDDLDSQGWLDTDAPWRDFIFNVLRGVPQTRARIIITLKRRLLSRLAALAPELVTSAVHLEMATLASPCLDEILAREAKVLSAEHGVETDPLLLAAVTAEPTEHDHLAHPALALSRLDAALARAAVAYAVTATPEHFPQTEEPETTVVASPSVAGLAQTLAGRVQGQDEAIAAVTRRLALTAAGLELRPERPRGVFLFAGPTGTGKTELARQIAEAYYGDNERMIRLDMSEYAHDWAISRLAGPMPGYLGSNEPESWLTTRVAAMPQCVLLLDEIEKAHQAVWSTFLQVFDAGRLTDSRGVTADFRDCIIIMTSNLGADRLGAIPEGATHQHRHDVTMGAIRAVLPPEFVNRIDEVTVFNPLDLATITAIGRAEFERVMERLSREGWHLEVEPEVPDWLATHHYDAAFGARHLERVIEREFLTPLALADGRRLRVSVEADGLCVEPLPEAVEQGWWATPPEARIP